MDESMTYRHTVIEPGNVGRGGGRRVIIGLSIKLLRKKFSHRAHRR